MDRNGRIVAISFILALVVSVSGAVFAGPEGARVDEQATVKLEKPLCLPNAPTYIGVYMDDVTDKTRGQYDYPHESGVIITDLVENGPAAQAGLKEHDIIYRLNDTTVENGVQFCSLVQAKKPGDKVTLVVYRDGKRKTVEVTLGRRKLPVKLSTDAIKSVQEAFDKAREGRASALRIFGESSAMRGRLGMVVRDLNKDLAPYFGVKENEGVLVLEVTEDSPAEKAGVKAGDVITAVNGTAVDDVEALTDQVSDAEDGDTLAVQVVRRGASKTVDVVVEASDEDYYFYTAPFEWNLKKIERPSKPEKPERSELERADREKLKEDIKALKERLKELEERLGKVEKSE
jgi:serine protease Do